jgi:electron transfer flavoprotein alpha subunit
MAIGKIWVIIERQGDVVSSTSLELLTGARNLADTVEAVTWGDASIVAAELGAYGAAAVYTVGDVADALPGPSVSSVLAAQVAGGDGPNAILIPHSYDGRDIAARLSVKIDRSVITNVVGLRDDGGLLTAHAAFGGTEIVDARFTGDEPGIYVVRSKSITAKACDGPPAVIHNWEPVDLGATGSAVITAHYVEESEGPKLDEANVVVSGGRGLGDAEAYQLVEALAKLLHGAAGASRAIVDAGWVPYARQVGQTGKTVKPTVCIAAGISGATQHMVGMKQAKYIVAINKDEEAPIFGIANQGILGDVHRVLPRLIEALQARA